ncbi:MerR family transcriptional regulator [Enterococcus sp. LJL51]|uniref:MerR family transcriptional regulator n=1 Tax=Enterococcus sp. LJL51 TaxID=3416656 RepID=UPI003CEDF347
MTYSIKEVSELFSLSIPTIHFYDKQGLLPFVSKNSSGHRAFTESDLYLMQPICCLKNTGMPIKDIRAFIDCVLKGPDTIAARKELLSTHKSNVLA